MLRSTDLECTFVGCIPHGKTPLASTFARYHLEFGNKHNRAQMNLNPISGSHHIQASLYGSSKSSHKYIRLNFYVNNHMRCTS